MFGSSDILSRQPAQPKYLHLLTHGILKAIGYWQRYLCLPRFSPESAVELGPPRSPPGSVARMRPTRYLWVYAIDPKSFIIVYDSFRAIPWYKAESKGLGALVDRFAVTIGFYDCLPDRKYKSEGYRLEELVRSSHQHSRLLILLIIITQGPPHLQNSMPFCSHRINGPSLILPV